MQRTAKESSSQFLEVECSDAKFYDEPHTIARTHAVATIECRHFTAECKGRHRRYCFVEVKSTTSHPSDIDCTQWGGHGRVLHASSARAAIKREPQIERSYCDHAGERSRKSGLNRRRFAQ